MKNIVTAGFLALSFLVSSCATMLKGTTDQVTVISDPPGAQVTSNDVLVGVTPMSFTVESKRDLNLQVSKDGYQPQTIENEATFRWGYEVWAFLVYIIPGVVDCADGAAWGHDNLVMTTHLTPIAQPSPAAPTAATPATVAPVATTVATVPATTKP